MIVASGYDLSNKSTYRLMQGRFGIYNHPFKDGILDLEGIQNQQNRLGKNLQQSRMIRDKRKTLDRVVWNSYQGAEILRVDAESNIPFRALITPNKVIQSYDDKTVSVGWEYEVKPGTVFEWVGTNSYWIVYLQDMTELAYFRGDIRRCSYDISWLDENGEKKKTYAAIRGPVETKINYIQKHENSVDKPNFSINFLVPRNEDTLKQFKRYSKFYLKNIEPGADNLCWRIEAVDWISTPGIIEVNAVEYYANLDKDDLEAGLVGSLIQSPVDPNFPDERSKSSPKNNIIVGDTFIKIKKIYEYIANDQYDREWKIDPKYPVKYQVDPKNKKKMRLRWESGFSGQFELYYGDAKKIIVVESLF